MNWIHCVVKTIWLEKNNCKKKNQFYDSPKVWKKIWTKENKEKKIKGIKKELK